MVNKDEDLIFAVFQAVVPSIKAFNNSQELLIMSLVLSLSGNHLLRKKGYWVPLANFGFRKIWIFVVYVSGKMLIQGHLT